MTNESTKHKRIEFSPLFKKRLESAPTEIKIAFREAYDLFKENQNHLLLRNHTVTGQYAGMRSINVTDDWRALYRMESERFVFMTIGTHEMLYG